MSDDNAFIPPAAAGSVENDIFQLVVECQLMEWSESRAVFAFPNGADNRKPLSCEESTGASRGFPR